LNRDFFHPPAPNARIQDLTIDERDPMIVPIKRYPFLDPIRDDPRLTVLLRKMKLKG
jgi:hypothetical protein